MRRAAACSVILAIVAACPTSPARPGDERDADAGDGGAPAALDASGPDVTGSHGGAPDAGLFCGCTGFTCTGPYLAGPDSWPACPPGTICALDGVCTAPQYSIDTDSTVSDDVTGLVWQRTSPPGFYTLGWGTSPPAAADYCAGLNSDGGAWRVPVLPELWSLVNLQSARSIDPTAFPSLDVSVSYWTSTTSSDESQGAGIYFPTNLVYTFDVNVPSEFGQVQSEIRVLCVESPADGQDGGFVTPGSGDTPDAGGACTCASVATCTDSCGQTDQWAPSCFGLQCDAQNDGYDTCGVPTCGVTACTCDFENGCTLCGKGSVCVAGAVPDGGSSQGVCTTPHYDVGDAGTVLDEVTGLEWQQVPPVGQFGLPVDSYSPADNLPVTYCQALELDGSGWRLPTLPELWSLVDVAWIPAVDPTAFPASPDLFATSTESADFGGSAAVSFEYGWSGPELINYEVFVYGHVRCVRDSFQER